MEPKTTIKRNLKLHKRESFGIKSIFKKEYEPIISLAIMMGAVFIIGYLLLISGFFV
ncbi:MAG: hypothetical protein AAGI07_08590 [Bacteroidota bacterium]